MNDSEKRFLYTMCAQLAHKGKDTTETMGWALLAFKSMQDTPFSDSEKDLLTKAVDATLAVTQRALDSTNDLEARIRLQAVLSAYENIKREIANVVSKEE